MALITLLYMYQIRLRDLESIAIKIMAPKMASVATSPIVEVKAPMIKAAELTVINPTAAIKATRKIPPVTPSGLSQNVFGLYPSMSISLKTKGVIRFAGYLPGSGSVASGTLLQNHLPFDQVFHWQN